MRGTTEAINLVAQSWGRRNVGTGDEIVITWLEHHANIVPWQQLCAEKGARLRVAPVDDDGQVLLDEYEKLLGPRTRLVSFTQVSNALGTITPAREMIAMAHRHGARVLVDGAQAVSHMRVDVQALDCDFYVFSGHKVFAPTGIGVVYGKGELLDAMPPWQGGGNMIAGRHVREDASTSERPARFEAGTGNIADAVGLGAALDYVERIGIENIARYEHELLVYATAALRSDSRPAPDRHRAREGRRAVVRARRLHAPRTSARRSTAKASRCAPATTARSRSCGASASRATVRPSLALYNTCEDIDALVAAVHRIKTGHIPH